MWEFRQISEDGDMGWARPVPDGYLFAWGAGHHADGTPHPGGWCYDRFDEAGDLDTEVFHVTAATWSADEAKAAADERMNAASDYPR